MQGTIQILHAQISTNYLVDDDRDFPFVDKVSSRIHWTELAATCGVWLCRQWQDTKSNSWHITSHHHQRDYAAKEPPKIFMAEICSGRSEWCRLPVLDFLRVPGIEAENYSCRSGWCRLLSHSPGVETNWQEICGDNWWPSVFVVLPESKERSRGWTVVAYSF